MGHAMLNLYRKISMVSTEMVECARQGDWDALVEAERRCKALINDLRALGEREMTPEEFEEKRRIFRKMLAEDAEIRDLAQPWMRRLQTILASASNERRLDASYKGLL